MKSDKIKIIFWGTPEFAAVILKALFEERMAVMGVVTALDMLVGRKQVLTPPPVKEVAQEKGIKVWQPEKLDDNFIKELKRKEVDLFVVAAYGQIIPGEIINLPSYKSLNVHPSLLPKYRGASPIQSVLRDGERETGTSIMVMDEKMDHGPILSSAKCQVLEREKFEELGNKLAELSAKLLIKTIPDYVSGKIKPQEQNHEQATFCKIIKKSDGEIDWHKGAREIYNSWRAFSVWPGIFSSLTINNKQLTIKFIEVELIDEISDKEPGEFVVQDKKLFIVAGDKKMLEVKKMQPEGKKVMAAGDFINGYLR